MSDNRLYSGVDLAQATASQKVPVLLVDSSSAGVASLTSPTIVASKNGASNASLSDGTWAELGNGLYTIRLNDTDTDTAGWLAITVSHGSAETAIVLCEISVSPNEKRTDYIRQRASYRRMT